MAERKSPEERAAEELELAQRVLAKAKEREERLTEDLRKATLARKDAERRHVYASESPYLPANQESIDAEVHGADEDEAARAAKAQALADKVGGKDDDVL